jgi:hypothetical protein
MVMVGQMAGAVGSAAPTDAMFGTPLRKARSGHRES